MRCKAAMNPDDSRACYLDVDFVVVFGLVAFGASPVLTLVPSFGVPVVCRLGVLAFGFVMGPVPVWGAVIVLGEVPICRLGSLVFGFVMVAVLGC